MLLYTSELKEVQLACDRAIVIFGGRVVAEMAAADADEPTLLRAAYNLRGADASRAPRSSRRPRRARRLADAGAGRADRRRRGRDPGGGR